MIYHLLEVWPLEELDERLFDGIIRKFLERDIGTRKQTLIAWLTLLLHRMGRETYVGALPIGQRLVPRVIQPVALLANDKLSDTVGQRAESASRANCLQRDRKLGCIVYCEQNVQELYKNCGAVLDKEH